MKNTMSTNDCADCPPTTQPQPPSESQQPCATATTQVALPKITITFCTQCKWMLRAAYVCSPFPALPNTISPGGAGRPLTANAKQYAQELLSTFGGALGEISLKPVTGGVFTVEILYGVESGATHARLWDRKTESGFPGAFLAPAAGEGLQLKRECVYVYGWC